MDCTIRHIHDVTVLDLKGRLSLGEALAFGPGSDIVLTETIRDLLKAGHKKILLNLAAITYADSSGVGQLAGTLATGRTRGLELKLLSPVKQVRDLLRVTHLESIFDIQDDEAAALASFSQGTAAGA